MTLTESILAILLAVAVTFIFARRTPAAVQPSGSMPFPYKGPPIDHLSGLTPGPVAHVPLPAFVHPLRYDFHHAVCGTTTTFGVEDAQWIARGAPPPTLHCVACALDVPVASLTFADGSGLVSAAASATPPVRTS